jgi:dihydroxyacetone kinase
VTSSAKPRALPPSATIESAIARAASLSMSVTITSAPGRRRPARDRGAVAAAGAGHQGEASRAATSFMARRLQRLADHRLVADMVDQQQDQPRVEGAALLVAQAFVGVDEGVVDVVGRGQVERASQRAFHRAS